MNRNNAKYGNPRGQTRKQKLKTKLSLQKPEKLNGKKTKRCNYLQHTVQDCIDSESMATCVDLTDSVNEPTHQMANLPLIYLSGFLQNICTHIFITKPILYARELAILLRYFLHFQLQLINIARHNILPV